MTEYYLVERTQEVLIRADDFEVADMEPGAGAAKELAFEFDEWMTVNVEVTEVAGDGV